MRASRKLAQRLDHTPTPEEIAEEVDKPVADVLKILSLSERISSIDIPVADNEKSLVETISAGGSFSPELSHDEVVIFVCLFVCFVCELLFVVRFVLSCWVVVD